VNIASLPSTVTLIAGADRSRDVGCCAGAGGVACARTAIGANTHAHSPANIHRRIIFLTLLPQFPPGLAKTGETEHAALPAERMEGLAGPTNVRSPRCIVSIYKALAQSVKNSGILLDATRAALAEQLLPPPKPSAYSEDAPDRQIGWLAIHAERPQPLSLYSATVPVFYSATIPLCSGAARCASLSISDDGPLAEAGPKGCIVGRRTLLCHLFARSTGA